jgi:hypothetical protein
MVRVMKSRRLREAGRVAGIGKMHTASCDGGKVSEKSSSKIEMEIGALTL